ncbi:MAG: exodeoxyribonuclease VII small subunit [Paludibacteraceae bacterium]
MAKSKQTYSEVVVELEKILLELENDTNINMEVIAEKVKRASVLLEMCKKQLYEIDVDLEKMLAALE